MEARRDYSNIFKVLREKKKLSTTNSVSGKLFVKDKEEMKIFSDKQKLRKFMTTRLALQEMLKEVPRD